MACEARSRWLPRICRLRPRSFFPARRRPGPRRGPTLLYRQGWAWPLRRRVPSETRGGLAPAASRDQATVPAPPAPPPPWSAGLEPLDASPAAAAEGPLRLREAPPPRRAASPCGRVLVHAAAREDYVGSALVTHPLLGLGGTEGSGAGDPQSHPGAWELWLWGLGGSFNSKFSLKPTSNKIRPEDVGRPEGGSQGDP